MTEPKLVLWKRPPPLAVPLPLSPAIIALDEAAKRFEEGARARSTRETYARWWTSFSRWCEEHKLVDFPAEPKTVQRYVVSLAERGLLPASIAVATSAIRAQHFDANSYDPTSHPSVRLVLRGIRRERGVRPKKKKALSVEQLARICEALPLDATGIRDRAILLLAFAGFFRRAALANLDVEDVEVLPKQIRVFIERDKRDQEAKGRDVVVSAGDRPGTCPVRAMVAWLDLLGRTEGPLFVRVRSGRRSGQGKPPPPAKLTKQKMSGETVARVLKVRAAAVGIQIDELAGHSLRRGGATAAANAKKTIDRIKAQGGWTKTETVLGYIDEANAGDEDNASHGIGL